MGLKKYKPQSILSAEGAPNGVISDLSIEEGEFTFKEDNEGDGGDEPLLSFAQISPALVVGEFAYKTTGNVRVHSSSSAMATAQVECLVIGVIPGGTTMISALPVGGKLTPEMITALAAASVVVNAFDTYHLGTDGKPTLTPPTSTGEVVKEVIVQGQIVEKQAYLVGAETEPQIEVNSTGTDTLFAGMKRKTVICNSGSGFSRTLPTINSSNNGVKFLYKNIGAGTVTFPSTIEGTANRTITTNQRIEVLAQGGNWYIIG